MSDGHPALFLAAIEVAEQIGFTFDEPGDHLNDDGAWLYQLETDEKYGLIMAGPGQPVATEYPGWGELEVDPYHLAVFVDGALAAILNPKGGTVGGFVDVPVDHVTELEDHLIEKVAAEIEHLGGDAEPWRADP